MLATGLVVTDHTDDVLSILILGPGTLVVGALLADVITGREGGDCGAEQRTVKIFFILLKIFWKYFFENI